MSLLEWEVASRERECGPDYLALHHLSWGSCPSTLSLRTDGLVTTCWASVSPAVQQESGARGARPLLNYLLSSPLATPMPGSLNSKHKAKQTQVKCS